MDFKNNIKPITTNDIFYDLLVGGYIQPKSLLKKEDARKVQDAMHIINNFLNEAVDKGFIELI